MIDIVTMKPQKAICILTSIFFIISCVYLVLLRTELMTKELFQMSTNGASKNGILNKHLELFLNGQSSNVVRENELFDPTLTEEELEIINNCQERARDDLMIGYTGFVNDKNVCVNHHTYLKENDSILIEVGGNLGSDASLLTTLYNPRHLIVEPLHFYASVLEDTFKDNPRVTVLHFGLGKKTEKVMMEMNGEASNIYSKAGNTMVDVINSKEFFQNIGVGIFSVDLLTMDCEGCELDVLESLVESGLVKYFKNIQFEQHSMTGFVNREEYLRRYCTLQEYMQRTHQLTFQYKHIWENWRLLDLK